MKKMRYDSYFTSFNPNTPDAPCFKEFLDPNNDFSPENILFNLERSFKTEYLFKKHFYKQDRKKEIMGEIDKIVSKTGYIKKRRIEARQIADELIFNCQRHGTDEYLNTIYISKSADRGIIATLNKFDQSIEIEKIKNKLLRFQQSEMSDVGPIDWSDSGGANIGIDLILHQSTSFGLLIRDDKILCFSVFAISNKNRQQGCSNIAFGNMVEIDENDESPL